MYNDGKVLDAREHSRGIASLKGYWKNNGLAQWKDLKGSAHSTNNYFSETLLLPAGVDASRDNQGFLMNRQKDTNSLNIPDEIESNNSGTWVDMKDNPISDWNNFTVTAWVKPKHQLAENTSILMIAVSYTHLTLPTTPYV